MAKGNLEEDRRMGEEHHWVSLIEGVLGPQQGTGLHGDPSPWFKRSEEPRSCVNYNSYYIYKSLFMATSTKTNNPLISYW